MHQIIVKDNKTAQFKTDNQQLFSELRKYLSFKIEGVEYSGAFKNGWDGVTYLLSATKGLFGLGLLPKVEEFLNDRKEPYEIDDLRTAPIAAPELDIASRLASIGMVPREHQIRILEAAKQHDKGIIRACTGSGKSACTAMITAKFNKPTNIYVIGIDLLQQFHDLFSSIFDEPIGYVGNGVCNIERINIVSIWTIGKALNVDKKELLSDDDELSREETPSQANYAKIVKMLETTKIHCFDESHTVTTGTIKAIYKIINPERIYGFSGTPYRDDNTDLLINSILGEQIIDVSASELIKKGLLAQPTIQFLTIPNQQFPGDNYQTVYKKYIVENDYRNDLIVKSTKQLLKQKYKPLVLFKQIKHGEILFDLLNEAGISCALLSGTDSLEDRNEVKNKLISGAIEVILASSIFDIGIDVSALSGLVLAGGGRSSIRTLQRVGRVIRGGKKYAAIIDFYDQSKYLKKHSKIRYGIYRGERGFNVIKWKEKY